MEISGILQADNIYLDRDITSKQEAIQFLCNSLDASGCLLDRNKFEKDVWHREVLGGTAAGEGIAIPHGISSAINKITVAFLRCKKEIDWHDENIPTMKPEKVRLIFLFGVPKEVRADLDNGYIQALKLIMGALAVGENVSRLLKAQSPQHITNILSNREGSNG